MAEYTDTFSSTGTTTWTAPDGIATLTIECWGARGGYGGDNYGGDHTGGNPGNGGYVKASYDSISGGTTLEIAVGDYGGNGGDGAKQDAGWGGSAGTNGIVNGGDGNPGAAPGDQTNNAGGGGGGGGAGSLVRLNSDQTLLALAGGGGGGGGAGDDLDSAGGGGGGGGSDGGLGGAAGGDATPGSDAGTLSTSSGGDGADGTVSTSAPDGNPGSYAAPNASLDTGSNGSNGGDGEVVLTYTIEPPNAPSNLTATGGDGQVDLSWDDDSTSEDGFYVYRATSSGSTASDYSQIADLGANTTSYTDSDVTEGDTYYYRVSAYSTDGGESSLSNEDSDTVSLPAPTNLSVDAINGDEFDLSWTDNAADEDGYRVLLSTDGGSSFSQDGSDLAAGTTSYTTSDLLDGEEYTIKVRVFNQHATSDSGTVTATTELPDLAASDITLGNGVGDEIVIDWTDVIDNGSYRIQLEETDTSTDWDSGNPGWYETTVGEATTSDTVTNREDGEEYRARMRTETAHVTGTWTSAKTIVTKFPGASNPSIASKTGTSVTVGWTDNSDNEDGFRLKREEYINGSWAADQIVATADPDITSATDDTVTPGTEYRYRVEAHTEHTSATSSTVTATTDDPGLPGDRGALPDGWHVEVDHPDGTTISPTVRDAIRPQRTLMGQPTAEIPVPPADRWGRDDWDGQPIRVYHDGDQLPLDEVAGIDTSPSGATITAVGGVELEQRVATEVQERQAHLEAEDLITTHTGYAANVDAPDPDPLTNEPLQSADTTTEFEAIIDPPSTSPLHSINGTVQSYQTAFTTEAENYDRESGTPTTNANSNASAGTELTIPIQDGNYVEFDFSLDYTIPADEFFAAVRLWADGSTDIPTFNLFLDGTKIGEISAPSGSYGWRTADSSNPGYSISSDISAGSHTLRVEVGFVGSSPPPTYLDVVTPGDNRYSYTFDNSISSGERVDGPEDYPNAIPAEFDVAATPYAVTGARAELTIDDTSNGQAIHLSNDGGQTYPLSSSNTATYEADFGDRGPNLRLKVDLSRYGSRTDATPATGVNPQTLDAHTLAGDLKDIPILVNRSFEGNLGEILRGIASYGDFIWEYRLDANGNPTIEWTRPGLRSADVSPTVLDYSTSTDYSSVTTKAIVSGSAIGAEERFTANHGAAVALSQDYLLTSSEMVTDPSTGTAYERGTDYEMDYSVGEITTLSGGAMSDAAEYAIQYRYEPRGSFEDDTHSGDARNEEFLKVPSVSTDRGAQQAAFTVVRQAKDPIRRASIEIDRSEAGWSLVDALALEELPIDEQLAIYSIDETPQSVSLELGSRDQLTEIVSRLEERIASASKRV